MLQKDPAGTAGISDADWMDIYAANVMTAVHVFRNVVPAMKARRSGRIVTISSSAGLRPSLTGIQSYCSAKHGLVGLTRQLALELGPYGVTVNSVAPGFLRTSPDYERQWQSYGPERQQRMVEGIAMRRLGEPQDIADVALFLDLAKRATGDRLAVLEAARATEVDLYVKDVAAALADMIVEDSYEGPRMEAGPDGALRVTPAFVRAMLDAFREQRLIHRRYAFEIILQAQALLRLREAGQQITGHPQGTGGGFVPRQKQKTHLVHQLLEAETLVDDQLKRLGQSRYIIERDESSELRRIYRFVRQTLSLDATIYVTFSKPLGKEKDSRAAGEDVSHYTVTTPDGATLVLAPGSAHFNEAGNTLRLRFDEPEKFPRGRYQFAAKGIKVRVEFSWGATEVKARLLDGIEIGAGLGGKHGGAQRKGGRQQRGGDG